MSIKQITLVKGKQLGVVLVVVMILLFIVTLLGITGAKNTIMEERMAGNYRDTQIAFEAAEASLRVAEAALLNTTSFDAMKWDGTDGTHEADPSLDPSSTNNSVTVTDSIIVAQTNTNPKYYIERLPKITLPGSSLVVGYTYGAPKIRFYRVTSYGYGKSPNVEVILQSTVY